MYIYYVCMFIYIYIYIYTYIEREREREIHCRITAICIAWLLPPASAAACFARQ